MNAALDKELATVLNTKAIERIEKSLEKIPTKDETKLMFIEESRKLADGLIRRLDEHQDKIVLQDKEILNIKADIADSNALVKKVEDQQTKLTTQDKEISHIKSFIKWVMIICSGAWGIIAALIVKNWWRLW